MIIMRYLLNNFSDIQDNENPSVFVNNSFIVMDADSFENYGYYIIGTLMFIIMLLGISTNFAFLYTYIRNKKVRTSDNTLIFGLSLSDLGNAIFGVPFVIVSSFNRKWIFGHGLCQFYAYVTTAFGITQITMLTVIALERYFVIVRRDRTFTRTPFRCIIIIFGCFGYGSFWATGPLLGWSGYKEEDVGIACCVKWEKKDVVSLSYTISLGIFGWMIPLFIIAFGYINIACKIYNERSKRAYIRKQNIAKTKMETKVAVTTLTMIGAFIISWTPYSIVSFWSAIGDHQKIPLWVFVAPAVFAKCSIIWNPLIYVGRHKQFRNDIKKSFRCQDVLYRNRSQSDLEGMRLQTRTSENRLVNRSL